MCWFGWEIAQRRFFVLTKIYNASVVNLLWHNLLYVFCICFYDWKLFPPWNDPHMFNSVPGFWWTDSTCTEFSVPKPLWNCQGESASYATAGVGWTDTCKRWHCRIINQLHVETTKYGFETRHKTYSMCSITTNSLTCCAVMVERQRKWTNMTHENILEDSVWLWYVAANQRGTFTAQLSLSNKIEKWFSYVTFLQKFVYFHTWMSVQFQNNWFWHNWLRKWLTELTVLFFNQCN